MLVLNFALETIWMFLFPLKLEDTMAMISHNTSIVGSFLSQRIEKCCWVYIFKKGYQFEH